MPMHFEFCLLSKNSAVLCTDNLYWQTDELRVQELIDTDVTSCSILQAPGVSLHFVAVNITTLNNFVRQKLWSETHAT